SQHTIRHAPRCQKRRRVRLGAPFGSLRQTRLMGQGLPYGAVNAVAGTPQNETARRCGPSRTHQLRGVVQLQPANLNEPTRVLQLNAPFAVRYSVVNQNVQSSTGSSVNAL